jgi:hypothetical protein
MAAQPIAREDVEQLRLRFAQHRQMHAARTRSPRRPLTAKMRSLFFSKRWPGARAMQESENGKTYCQIIRLHFGPPVTD